MYSMKLETSLQNLLDHLIESGRGVNYPLYISMDNIHRNLLWYTIGPRKTLLWWENFGRIFLILIYIFLNDVLHSRFLSQYTWPAQLTIYLTQYTWLCVCGEVSMSECVHRIFSSIVGRRDSNFLLLMLHCTCGPWEERRDARADLGSP